MESNQAQNSWPDVAMYLIFTADTVCATKNDGWRLRASFGALERDLALLMVFAAMPTAGPPRSATNPPDYLVDFNIARVGHIGLGAVVGGDHAIATSKGLVFPRLGWRLLAPWSIPVRTLIARLLTLDALTLGTTRWVRLGWLEQGDVSTLMAMGEIAGISPARFYPERSLHRLN